jgi:hypothetical protein
VQVLEKGLRFPDFSSRRNAVLSAIVVAILATGCGDDKSVKTDTAKVVAKTSSTAAGDSSSGKDSVPLGPLKGVDGVTLGGDCPDPGPSAAAERAAQASALIPLKVGLTLSHNWRPTDSDYDHECLIQVTAIDDRSILTTGSCPHGENKKRRGWVRRLCRTDLRDSYVYETSEHATFPEVIGGTLEFSLSSKSFAELKTTGQTRHRYLELSSLPFRISDDIDGTFKSEGKSTFKIIVNNRTIEVPTIEATYRSDEKHRLIRVKVLDDERFPLVLDYYFPGPSFFITHTKVSYPGEIEEQLATNKKVDVYGIYFDFASDSIRPESEPVLREIAEALASNKEWTLTINGHTDSVGDNASNLDLSRRRSEAVKKAMVERYKVDASRLSTSGFGASQPKESNDTDIGRARNRRVELIRQ